MARRVEMGSCSLFPALAAERKPDRLFADVALNRPLRREFTYAVPEDLRGRVAPGRRVVVPLGRRREVGVVVALAGECELAAKRVRAVAQVLDEEPIVGADLLELTRWMAGYYACSWGEALAAALPAALKREGGRRRVLTVRAREGVGEDELAELEDRFPKQHRLLRTLIGVGEPIELRSLTRRLNVSDAPARTLERRGWVTIEKIDAVPDPLSGASGERARPERLSSGQAHAVEAIAERVEAGGSGTFLLHGITGSGKTEVYLRAIERALAAGRGAIVLVPEIALTPQTVSWFRSRFGEVAILHSGMTDAQRLDMWLRLHRGEARVVVGARSAVFAPVRDLGVIVVDEEHEPSFKQENSPRYHARDVAVVRARNAGAVCVLGSATPSLESCKNAREGRYELLQLPERVSGGRLPSIGIVDMRQEGAPHPASGAAGGGKGRERGVPRLFSRRLANRLEQTLGRGEQSILFLNRRGFAPVLWCQACGETLRCRQCDVTLTFHRGIRRVVCHLCCEESAPPKDCPSCTAPALRYLGLGSERVESALTELLPGARVARMDSDTMHRRQDYERTLDAFGRGEIDVLVGTQMIAKGHDFPRVTLVGVISADVGLGLADFRAAERTFQLLTQVAGRAGRGERLGEAIVQTLYPGHYSIVLACQQDYPAFFERERAYRRAMRYPPDVAMISVVVRGRTFEEAMEAALHVVTGLEPAATRARFHVLGPAPAPLGRLRGEHRVQCFLKGTRRAEMRRALKAVLQHMPEVRRRVTVDVDPLSML